MSKAVDQYAALQECILNTVRHSFNAAVAKVNTDNPDDEPVPEVASLHDVLKRTDTLRYAHHVLQTPAFRLNHKDPDGLNFNQQVRVVLDSVQSILRTRGA